MSRYNEAIWLSGSGQYSEAKSLIAPLINDTSLSKKPEIAELYGDLIFSMSGSLDDTIRMYDRSLSFSPSVRVSDKLRYMRQLQDTQSGSLGDTLTLSGETASPSQTDSGSQEREAKKIELQKISSERDKYLGNTSSSQTSARSEIEKLIQSTRSGDAPITQDW